MALGSRLDLFQYFIPFCSMISMPTFGRLTINTFATFSFGFVSIITYIYYINRVNRELVAKWEWEWKWKSVA